MSFLYREIGLTQLGIDHIVKLDRPSKLLRLGKRIINEKFCPVSFTVAPGYIQSTAEVYQPFHRNSTVILHRLGVKLLPTGHPVTSYIFQGNSIRAGVVNLMDKTKFEIGFSEISIRPALHAMNVRCATPKIKPGLYHEIEAVPPLKGHAL